MHRQKSATTGDGQRTRRRNDVISRELLRERHSFRCGWHRQTNLWREFARRCWRLSSVDWCERIGRSGGQAPPCLTAPLPCPADSQQNRTRAMAEICAAYLVGAILAAILLLLANAIRETSTVKALGCPMTILLWPLFPIFPLLAKRIRRRRQRSTIANKSN
jgi:hypothetical protein